ncbi:MAG: DMT family transporter [Epsilonproteobacteria bacterium]|nr:DMT family transporter [Campylobacterota bacterium]
MVLASLLFSLMGVFAKLLSFHMPPLEVVFFRNIFGVLFVGVSFFKKPLQKEGGRPFLLLFRGVAGFIALALFFYNIAHIPLGEAITYSKTSPIWTALFAYLFLKEKLSWQAWLAIFLGFLGVVLITDPFLTPFDRYDLFGIGSGIGAALAYTSIRELKKYYDTRAIVLSFMGVGTVAPILLFLFTPEIEGIDLNFVIPNPNLWGMILAMGILATLAQLLMTKAYSLAKAGVVATISYTTIFFSILLGTLFLGDPFPNLIKILGIILIVFSGVSVALSKK